MLLMQRKKKQLILSKIKNQSSDNFAGQIYQIDRGNNYELR